MRNLLLFGWAALIVTAAHATDAGSPAGDRQRIEAGRRIYQQQCAACHGVKAEGAPRWQERNAEGEMPPPPHGPRGHTWKHSDAMLYRIISNGWRDPFNKTERLTMPSFRDRLSPEEIQSVIAYLKTLWTAKQQRFQREEGKGHPFSPVERKAPGTAKTIHPQHKGT